MAKKKTILVTGGAGFIGSHLCDRLLDLGHKVICVDNFNDSYPPAFKRENIANAKKYRRFLLYEVDICDDVRLGQVFSKNKINTVIHLAARGGVAPSIALPAAYFKTNVEGTLNVLEKMRQFRISHLILASSSTVYGKDAKVPFSENDPPQKPTSPYGASKIAAESIAYTYSHLYGIKTTILRFFNVYGPRVRPDMALYKFAENISKNLPVYENRGHRRDFTYIDDIIDGVLKALNKKFDFEVINLGRSQPVAVHRYILEIGKALEVPPKIIVRNPPLEEIVQTRADVRKAKKLLNFSPKISVKEGVRRYIEWYREHKKTNGARPKNESGNRHHADRK